MEVLEFLAAVKDIETIYDAPYWIAAEKYGNNGTLMVQAVSSESSDFIVSLADKVDAEWGRVMKELEVGKPKVPVYAIYFF